MKGDNLLGSAHTPMYNPHILPLTFMVNLGIYGIYGIYK